MPETNYSPDPRERPIMYVASRGLGGGAGGSVFVGHYSGFAPNVTPPQGSTGAVAFDLDTTGQWWWNGSQWI